MEQPDTNFLKFLRTEGSRQIKRIPRFLFYPIIIAVAGIGILSFQIILSDESTTDSFLTRHFFTNPLSLGQDRPLAGEAEDRINILLTGMGGAGHPGPYLTDTMILASIRPSDRKLTLLSLPRDLSLPFPGEGWRKINALNAYAEATEAGTGARKTAEALSRALDTPIHYYIRADFAGFEQLIDELNGIKIYVDNSFIDRQFPDSNYGYRTVSFSKGWQKMDGATALAYVRSRHGTNGESSDFARSQRQQKVIKAVKDNALSLTTFMNIRKIGALLDIYQKNISTNLEPWEIYRLIRLERDITDANITTLVLDNHPSSPLYNKIVNGAYMLLPKDESLEQLKGIVANIFTDMDEFKRREQVVIDVRNGTFIEGLAARTSERLRQQGYTVANIGNAPKKDYEKTVIYDLTQGQKPNVLEVLRADLRANVTTTLPAWLESADEQGNPNALTDFIIILGTDQRA